MDVETLGMFQKTMGHFLEIGGLSYDYIRCMLLPFLDDLIDMYENDLLIFEDDWRSGEETYGYESEESVIEDMNHICDRWRCAFRVRWMIDLIDPDYYPYTNKKGDNYIPMEREF